MKIVAKNYGWLWTVLCLCDFKLTEDEKVYKWNISEFYNKIGILQNLEHARKYKEFTEINKK